MIALEGLVVTRIERLKACILSTFTHVLNGLHMPVCLAVAQHPVVMIN